MSFIFPPVCLIAEGDSTGHGHLSFEPSFLLCLAFGIMSVDSLSSYLGVFLLKEAIIKTRLATGHSALYSTNQKVSWQGHFFITFTVYKKSIPQGVCVSLY